jgi:hypothetical protein
MLSANLEVTHNKKISQMANENVDTYDGSSDSGMESQRVLLSAASFSALLIREPSMEEMKMVLAVQMRSMLRVTRAQRLTDSFERKRPSDRWNSKRLVH